MSVDCLSPRSCVCTFVSVCACSIQEGKEHLAEHIANYIMEKMVFADRIIAKNSAAKIGSNDVVLVYGRASAVEAGILRAHKDGTQFRGQSTSWCLCRFVGEKEKEGGLCGCV